MEHKANHIILRGSLSELPQFSHENHGRRFFRLMLEVARLSGTVDTLSVIIEESVLNSADLSAGEMLTVTGQIRSHNIRTEQRRRLLIFVLPPPWSVRTGNPSTKWYWRVPCAGSQLTGRPLWGGKFAI